MVFPSFYFANLIIHDRVVHGDKIVFMQIKSLELCREGLI